MSNITNKIVWQTADTEKSFVYALHPTLNCNMFSFQVQPGYRIGDDGKPTVTRKAECGEVARRLVVCWNACEGISTDYMEQIVWQGGNIDTEVKKRIAELVKRRNERNQLLTAALAARRTAKLVTDKSGHELIAIEPQLWRDIQAACQPHSLPSVAHLPADDTEGGAL